MDEIEVVIKIDKDTFKKYQESVDCEERAIIVHGTPLPKGHGKIGDLTKLYNEIDARNKGKDKGKYTSILALVGFANTIIEADKN